MNMLKQSFRVHLELNEWVPLLALDMLSHTTGMLLSVAKAKSSMSAYE